MNNHLAAMKVNNGPHVPHSNKRMKNGRGRPIPPFNHYSPKTNMLGSFHLWRLSAPDQQPRKKKSSNILTTYQIWSNNGTINRNEFQFIAINGVYKVLRFYGETAIVFMSWDDPREIYFQDGVYCVIINNIYHQVATKNWHCQEININGLTHRVWIGAPGREIYIDGVPYNCTFGGEAICTNINGVNTTVKLDGPYPQMTIAENRRTDLVAGKIHLNIVSNIKVPVFLDGKVQNFFLDGKLCSLQFVHELKAVLLNGIPHSVKYGGLPEPVVINGKEYLIRFSELPSHIKPGQVAIKGVERLSCSNPINSTDLSSRDGRKSAQEFQDLACCFVDHQQRETDDESQDCLAEHDETKQDTSRTDDRGDSTPSCERAKDDDVVINIAIDDDDNDV